MTRYYLPKVKYPKIHVGECLPNVQTKVDDSQFPGCGKSLFFRLTPQPPVEGPATRSKRPAVRAPVLVFRCVVEGVPKRKVRNQDWWYELGDDTQGVPLGAKVAVGDKDHLLRHINSTKYDDGTGCKSYEVPGTHMVDQSFVNEWLSDDKDSQKKTLPFQHMKPRDKRRKCFYNSSRYTCHLC